MWHCVISGGVIACQSARNCFKYYNLWYAVRFAWCHWGKISKFNIFHFLPASAVSVSDNFSSPHGDSRWGRGKWLEVTVHTRHRRCWPKEDCDIQRQCTLKWTSKKINDFRSSLRYWPWGIVVGVSQSGSYPIKAVALLLGESRAYGLSKVLGLYCFKTATTNDHEAHKRKEHLFIRWRTYQTVQLLVMSGNQQKQVISCKNSITQMESVWCGIKAQIP